MEAAPANQSPPEYIAGSEALYEACNYIWPGMVSLNSDGVIMLGEKVDWESVSDALYFSVLGDMRKFRPTLFGPIGTELHAVRRNDIEDFPGEWCRKSDSVRRQKSWNR